MSRKERTQELWNQYHRININNIVERQCTQCKNWLEENLNNFYLKNKKEPNRGYGAWCRICSINKSIERRHVDIAKTRKNDLKHYYNNKDRCFSSMKNYKENNREKVDADFKAWCQRNPDKLREYNFRHRKHDISENEWKSCLKVFDNQCAYCGLPIEKHVTKRNGNYIIMNLHKEHVDDEGYNDLRNAIPSCQNCNSSKHQHNMEMWYKEKDFFKEDRYNKIIWWTIEGYKDYIEEKPPYRIIKERNEGLSTYHFNLWSVDEMRNIVELIATKDKRKDLKEDINKYLQGIS